MGGRYTLISLTGFSVSLSGAYLRKTGQSLQNGYVMLQVPPTLLKGFSFQPSLVHKQVLWSSGLLISLA